MASQCLCLGQVPSFAIFLVRCKEPGRTRGTLFGNGIWRLRGRRGVSRTSCSPQYGSIVDVDIASDSHRPAFANNNAIGTCGKGGRGRGAEGHCGGRKACVPPALVPLHPECPHSSAFSISSLVPLPFAIGFLSPAFISVSGFFRLFLSL